MIKKFIVNDREIAYEDGEKDIIYGVQYLDRTLSREEAMVFIKQAYEHGSAQFEDKNRKQFTLMYAGGAYTLISRK
jgi:hypothetical protein